MASALFAMSASAFQRELFATGAIDVPTERNAVNKVSHDLTPRHIPLHKLSLKKVPKKTENTDVPDFIYYRPASNIGCFGMSAQSGSGYQGLGFANAYGNLNFYNFSTNAKSNMWTFSQVGDYEVVGSGSNQSIKWNTTTSSADSVLTVKSTVGEMMAPKLAVMFNSGESMTYQTGVDTYFCGGGADFYGLNQNNGEDIVGITFYQNQFLANDLKYTGATGVLNMYSVSERLDSLFNKEGVALRWQEIMDSVFMPDKKVENLRMENFIYCQPRPASAYVMSQAWMWMQVEVNKATQLISYIYPIDDDGKLVEYPIAMGYAAIPKDGTNIPVFNYTAINEDGDETGENIIIDTAVAITVEGFVGNDNIELVAPISGYYPISYKALQSSDDRSMLKNPDLYVSFSLTADGEQMEGYHAYDPVGYYFNGSANEDGSAVDDDTMTMHCYGQLSTDALYQFIFTADGVNSIEIPKRGGEVEVDLESMFYICQESVDDGTYVIESPEWIKVSVDPLDQNNPRNKITLSVSDVDDRTGVVSIKSLGVSLNLTVTQGVGSGVDMLPEAVDVEYYDISGRRIVNPEKGIYIKVKGGKSEKIIL